MRLIHLSIVVATAMAGAGLCQGAENAASVFQTKVLPVLNTYCTDCHGEKTQKARLNLSGVRNLEDLKASTDRWYRVLDEIQSGNMPPEDEKQPSQKEQDAVLSWIRTDFTQLHVEKQRSEGRSKLRRLSRSEYVNTMQDLFGLRPTVGINLPEDGRVDGYDKVSAALPFSTTAAVGYFKMPEDILKWMLKPLPKTVPATSPSAPPYAGEVKPAKVLSGIRRKGQPALPPLGAAFDPERTVRAVARESEQSKGHVLELADGIKVSFNTDTTSGPMKYPGTKVPGVHRLRLAVSGYQTNKPMAVGIYAGHTSAYPQILDLLQVIEVPPGKPVVLETEVYLRTRDLNDRSPVSDGIRLIPFGLGVQVPKNFQASDCKGPGMAVQWVDVERPAPLSPAEQWLVADIPDQLQEMMRASTDKPAVPEFLPAMRETFKRVGVRLYRRDLTAQELDEIMADLEAQVANKGTMRAMFLDKLAELMTTPDFLCVIEPAGPLPDFALASRLSYFLWNSTPDDALLEAARKGTLRDPNVVREHTERLLNDPRSNRFITDFVNQWLGLQALDDTSPDAHLYPGYDEFLKLSSRWETENFFSRVLDENLSVRNFVAAPWSMLNESLARLYEVPGVEGAELRQVNLPPNSAYGGVWTQSAIMKVTANGTNTSPVKRGRWVAERLLGTPIPPPPPNIKPVEPDVRGAKTLREQFALHAAEGSCASCHARFDPYGFALESFDVMGGFREHYRVVDAEVIALSGAERKGRPTWRDGLPVDSSGKTPDGKPFNGIRELRDALGGNPEAVALGVARHLVTYATGTVPTEVDNAALQKIVRSTARDDYGLRSLIHALVQSEIFTSK